MMMMSVALLPAFGQQKSNTEETRNRLRRTETRTTTPDLYPDRDTIVALLRKRMTALSAGNGATANLSGYFAPEATITQPDGTTQNPAAYLQNKLTYRDYRLRKLEINGTDANATETYAVTDAKGATKTTQVASSLKMDASGRWQITQMNVSSK